MSSRERFRACSRVDSTIVAVVMIVMVAWPGLARAQLPQREFVYGIEVWVGERPADADAVLDRIDPSLNRNRILLMGGSTASMIEALVAQSGNKLSDAELDAHVSRVEDARALYEANQCAEAIKLLDGVVVLPWRASLSVATDTRLRDAFRTGLAVMAMCKRVVATKESTAVKAQLLEEAKKYLGELARSFGDQPLGRQEFGSELWREYQQIEAELKASPGQVEVDVDDPAVVVYFNEQYVEVGHARVERPAGWYRVLLRKGSGSSTVSRLIDVEVTAGGTKKLTIPWHLMEALHSSPSWCCLLYPDKATRDRYLAADMQYLARESGKTLLALVVEPAQAGKPRRYSGAIYESGTSGPQRSAELAIDAGPTELDAVAAYWAGKADAPPSATAAAEQSKSMHLASKVTAGAGVLAIVGGFVWEYRTDPRFDGTAVTIRDPNMQAVSLTVAGSAAVGTGLMLWLRDAHRARWSAATTIGGGAALFLIGGTLVLTAEDPSPALPERIRNYATEGYVVGAVGLALVGVGIWRWDSDEPHGDVHARIASPSSAPIISVQRGGGLIGWGGSF